MAVDYDEIIQRAKSIAPALSVNANGCEAARQVLPESIRMMVEAGLFRILHRPGRRSIRDEYHSRFGLPVSAQVGRPADGLQDDRHRAALRCDFDSFVCIVRRPSPGLSRRA